MSTLFGLLNLGSGALAAQNQGIATSSNNAANVNTDGFSRQRIEHRSQLAAPLVGGVRATGPARISSDLLANRQRFAAGALGFASAFHGTLLDLESAMVASRNDVSASLGGFFAELAAVSTSPLDTNLRDAAVTSARQVVSSIRAQSTNLDAAQSEANVRLGDQSSLASQLASDIAEANRAAAVSDDPVLLDRREKAAAELAELVGGRARIDPDGAMRVTLANGAVVVDGNRAASFEAVTYPALGNLFRIDLVDGNHRQDVTAGIDGGSMGADLRFRDTVAVGMINDLDQFAFDVATELNAVHRTFEGGDGISGRDLFIEPGVVAGAAAAFALDPTIDSDPNLLAVAAIGAGAGDNSGALALLATKDQDLASGGTQTLSETSIQFMTGLGNEVRRAASAAELQEVQKTHIDSLKDSLSGVSLEEEMTALSQFRHAAEAAARFVSTVDDLLGNLIQTL